jgi:hypothetical protein
VGCFVGEHEVSLKMDRSNHQIAAKSIGQLRSSPGNCRACWRALIVRLLRPYAPILCNVQNVSMLHQFNGARAR